MRSRAALLPHPADPFMLRYWLKFYEKYWQSEVDHVYILINSPMEKPVIDYMLEVCNLYPNVEALYIDHQIEHGAAIDELLKVCKEEYVMLIEDDGYIFKSGVVDKYFTLLETGSFDVIGSPRGSCSMEIYEGARTKFNLSYEGLGDHGPNFWPNYLFTKKQTLLDTDRMFGARAWVTGEVVKELDLVVQPPGPLVSDTFVNTSLQLRAKFPNERILEIPQYHASPDDVEHFSKQESLFDGRAPWTHVGSLSSGVHGVLRDPEGRRLAKRFIEVPNTDPLGTCTTLQEQNEWERRVAFWSLFLDNAEEGKIEEFKELYRGAIRKIISEFNLSVTSIEKRKNIYHTLGL